MQMRNGCQHLVLVLQTMLHATTELTREATASRAWPQVRHRCPLHSEPESRQGSVALCDSELEMQKDSLAKAIEMYSKELATLNKGVALMQAEAQKMEEKEDKARKALVSIDERYEFLAGMHWQGRGGLKRGARSS